MTIDISEKELENFMIANLSSLKDKGFVDLYFNVSRQVAIPGTGIIDIFTWEIIDNIFKCKIIELKKGPLTFATLSQILKYYNGILEDLLGVVSRTEIDLIMVGSDITSDLHSTLYLGCNVQAYGYGFGFDGLTFTDLVENDKGPILNDNRYGIPYCDTSTVLSRLNQKSMIYSKLK